MSRDAVVEEVTSLLRSVAELALPRECAGCGRQERRLCRACLRRFGDPVRCEHLTQHLVATGTRPALATWSMAAYSGAVRHAILAWKSGGRPDLARPLTGLLARAAAAIAPSLLADDGGAGLLVIPAPSGAARRRAGRFVVGELADAVGAGVAEAVRNPVLVLDPLRRRASAGHLLGAAARRDERADAVRCLLELPPRAPCLLVDDVVTTGATLAACAAAVQAAGARAIGAIALAHTPPPGMPALAVQRV